MKIALLTSFFPPTHNGGTENYTHAIARGLAAGGLQIHVLCAGNWDTGQGYYNGFSDAHIDGVQVRRLHFNWRKAPDPNRYLYDNPVASGLVAKELARLEPDIVHITSCNSLSASILAASRDAVRPVVLTVTDFAFLCPRLTLLRKDGRLCSGMTTPWECLECMLLGTKAQRYSQRVVSAAQARSLLAGLSRSWLNRAPGLRGMALDMADRKRYMACAMRYADHVIAPSHFLARTHQAAGFDVPFEIQPHGHDLAWLAQKPPRQPGPGLRLGYLGNMLPIKGVDVLVRAVMQLSALTYLSLDLWGDDNRDPEYVESLRRLSAADPRIRLRGKYTRSQLGSILGSLDVTVVPSLCYENNPLVIQEAFAAGLPVVATNIGGMAEAVHDGWDGLLFAWNDVNALATQLRRLATEPGLLDSLRQHCPPVKTIEEEVHELANLYANLCAQAKARKPA